MKLKDSKNQIYDLIIIGFKGKVYSIFINFYAFLK